LEEHALVVFLVFVLLSTQRIIVHGEVGDVMFEGVVLGFPKSLFGSLLSLM
jgi:hypothetical protein